MNVSDVSDVSLPADDGRGISEAANGRGLCTQCGHPGGNEVAFGDGPSIWLRRECEDAFIDRRMREEGA